MHFFLKVSQASSKYKVSIKLLQTPTTLHTVHRLQKINITFVPDKYLLVKYKLKLPYSHVTNAMARVDITVKDPEAVIVLKCKGSEIRVHHGNRSEFSFQLCWQ